MVTSAIFPAKSDKTLEQLYLMNISNAIWALVFAYLLRTSN